EFCGMATSDSDSVNTEVSPEPEELYFEIVENINLNLKEFIYHKEKLTVYEKEMNTLTEERTRFYNMYEQAEANKVELYKNLKDKTVSFEKILKIKDDEIKRLKNERSNALSVKEF